jgi:hypothetical protein
MYRMRGKKKFYSKILRERERRAGDMYIDHVEKEMKKDEDSMIEFYSKIRDKALKQPDLVPGV